MAFANLKVGGVPEHFNAPWHIAFEKKMFKKSNINICWNDYFGGTGAMCEALRKGELDIAIVLTEGIVADIIKGNPSKIIQWYVTSPLQWGIHVPANSPYEKIEDVKDKKYAISRYGSGSHLMAHVDARMRGWDIKEEQFLVVNNIDGAREAFKNNQADVFLWEKFTTKPYIDAQEFRRIEVRPTPWPCFAIAATEKALAQYGAEIEKIQNIINESAANLMKEYNAPNIIALRYDLKRADVIQWIRVTDWATDNVINSYALDNVVSTLYELKLVDKKLSPAELCSHLTKLN